MINWYDHIPPVAADVACGGEVHRVTWRRGAVDLHDHDVTAERLLIAVGGEPCPCLDVADLWRHAGEDWKVLRHALVSDARLPRAPRPLPIGGHSPSRRSLPIDPVSLPPIALIPTGRAAVDTRRATSRANRRRADAQRRWHLIRQLPHDLRLRLALAAVTDRSDAIEAGADASGDVLDMTTLRTLLRPVVHRTAMAALAPDTVANVAVGCRLAGSGDDVHAMGHVVDGAADVFVRLSLGWIAEVWATQLADLGDRFTVAVSCRHSPDHVEALTCRWAPATAGTATLVTETADVHRSGAHWVVADPKS